MTRTHRNRLLLVATLVLVGIGFAVSPTFANEGLWAGIGLFLLSVLAPAAVLGVVAYVWSANDREAAKLTGRAPAQR
ncbi:hypothetical protein [Microbacterium testaceum]|uniref:hypothetical protein n=1 Tax=Microbacterium testaceum TaxID=2033 RepID=UPI00073437D0|nr:hypothetical protein [Microbacterium testaceum]KTS03617.1 hypothetical protein NS283_11520 [Microbacterium testaceum]